AAVLGTLPARVGEFVKIAEAHHVGAAIIVKAGRIAVGEGEGQRRVPQRAQAVVVEIAAGVARGFGQRPERVHGVGVVAQRAFVPESVVGHAFGDLRAEAAVGVIDGVHHQVLAPGGEAGAPHGAVLPALDVVDAHAVLADHFGGGHQEIVFNARALRRGERVAHQAVAPRHRNQPHAFVERLRHDAAAAHFILAGGVVPPVAGVARGVGGKDFAGAAGVSRVAGAAEGQAEIAHGLGVAAMHAVEDHRIVGLAGVLGAALGATVAGGGNGFELDAVARATVPVRPLPAAIGQFERRRERLAGVAQDAVERAFGPGAVFGFGLGGRDLVTVYEEPVAGRGSGAAHGERHTSRAENNSPAGRTMAHGALMISRIANLGNSRERAV